MPITLAILIQLSKEKPWLKLSSPNLWWREYLCMSIIYPLILWLYGPYIFPRPHLWFSSLIVSPNASCYGILVHPLSLSFSYFSPSNAKPLPSHIHYATIFHSTWFSFSLPLNADVTSTLNKQFDKRNHLINFTFDRRNHLYWRFRRTHL